MRLRRPSSPPGVWTLIAAASLLALVLAVVTQPDSLADEWIAGACQLLAAARLAGQARGPHRVRWGLLASGVGLYGLGSVWYAAFVGADPASSYGSVADVLWLGAYLPLAGALVAIVHHSFGARDNEAVLDGFIAALGAAALGTAIVVPALADAGADPLTAVVTLGYPVLDLLLIGIAVGGIVLAGRLTPSWRRLGGALLILIASDLLFASQVTAGGGVWALGGILALGSPTAFWLMASAVPEDDATAPGRSHMLMPVVPLVASVVAVGLLLVDHVAPVPGAAVLLAAAALALAVVRTAWTVRVNARLETTAQQALVDELTGLPNRRRLLRDLDRVARDSTAAAMLVLFDLDGFKAYNDAYGHPAGDGLLTALGQRLKRAVAGQGDAYRLGGDEFCILIATDDIDHQLLLESALAALHQEGDGFSIGASYGRVTVPEEAATSSAALQLADTRMYQRKDASRASTRRQSRDLLLQLLHEQQPDLEEHSGDVGELVAAVGRRLGLDSEALDHARHAAELHDVGKVAIPAAILGKPGPLDDDEWTLMRRHTIIGERILSSVPALVPVGRIVRATHERWDGDGYPDGLRGEEIPLGARVIAVCDTFHAITSDRPYREGRPADEALAELRRCAGTQFDPAVVDAFAAELAAGTLDADAGAGAVDGERGDARRLAPAGAIAQHAAGELAQLAKLRGLLRATQLARGGADIAEVLDAIARTIGSSLGFRVVSINLFRPEWDDFVCTAVQGDEAVRERLLGQCEPADSWRPLLQERFARDGAYFLPAGTVEFDDDIAWHVPDIEPTEDPGAWQADDMLLVPLRGARGEVLGMVSVDEPVWGRRPSDAAIEVLVAVAEHAALALQSARSSAIGRAARAAGHRAAELSGELVTATEAGQVAAAVATCVREALPFESVDVELVTTALDAEMLEELLAGVDADGGTAVLAGEAAWKARAWRGIAGSSRNGRGAQAWNDHMAVAPVRGAEGELLAVVWCDDPADRLLPHTSTMRVLRQIAAQAVVPLAWGRRVPAPAPNG